MEQPQNTKPARLWRWLKGLADLPLLRHTPLMDDDDCEFAGDMIYLRSLLDDLVDECRGKLLLDERAPGIAPIPAGSSVVLDAALELIKPPAFYAPSQNWAAA